MRATTRRLDTIHAHLGRFAATHVAPAATSESHADDLTYAERHRRSLSLLRSTRPVEEEPWRALPPLELTEQQMQFWDAFGFLALPGLLSDRAQQIIDDFEEVWREYGGGHDGKPHDNKSRSCIVPFLDSHPGLCSLLDDPRIVGLATALLGEDFNLMGSDGNCNALPLCSPQVRLPVAVDSHYLGCLLPCCVQTMQAILGGTQTVATPQVIRCTSKSLSTSTISREKRARCA